MRGDDRRRYSLSIIIPVFNGWEMTAACLRSLAAQTESGMFEVLVVDNGSTDATPEACPALGRELFGRGFSHIRSETNRNFGPACNRGAQEAAGERLLFLNNDTLLHEGWLPPLLAALEPADVGAAGPLLTYPPHGGAGFMADRVQHAGIAFEPQFYPRHLYELFPAAHPAVRRPRYFQALTGAALLLERGFFLELGGFCEEYANGGEDVDLGLRISAARKRQVCAVESRITHLTSQTPGRHAREEHNAALLKERCAALIRPDFHLFLEQDGYEPRLTPWLMVYAALPERRSRILDKQLARGMDPDRCSEMLLREPLWLAGYDWLAAHRERAGEWDDASDVRFLAARLHPHRERFVALQKAAAQAENAAHAGYAERMIAKLDGDVAAAGLEEMARGLAGFHRDIGQEKLVALYEEWQRTSGPGG